MLKIQKMDMLGEMRPISVSPIEEECTKKSYDFVLPFTAVIVQSERILKNLDCNN